jgi:DNA repair protein RadD
MYGINAPAITASTSEGERDRAAADFKAGRLKAICNVNVYTEGFNAKQVDCIVLLRPTLSKGLYVQMVGRGLRVHPNKTDCLVLDYANCISTHGPIDCIDEGSIALYTCKRCANVFSRQVRTCPHCGWTIPPQTIERLEAEERERRLHEIRASNRDILSGVPEEIPIDGVTVHRHAKQNMPDSLRIEYRCGLFVVREWICLDHQGPAGHKAAYWWKQRFGEPVPSVEEALEDMWLAQSIQQVTESLTVVRRGKYTEITAYKLRKIGNHAVTP